MLRLNDNVFFCVLYPYETASGSLNPRLFYASALWFAPSSPCHAALCLPCVLNNHSDFKTEIRCHLHCKVLPHSPHHRCMSLVFILIGSRVYFITTQSFSFDSFYAVVRVLGIGILYICLISFVSRSVNSLRQEVLF